MSEKHITLDRLKEISEYHAEILQRMIDKKDKGPLLIGAEAYRVDLAMDINQEFGALQAINALIKEIDGEHC